MVTSTEIFLFQDKCLSLLTYYIESNKEAIIIDPMRDHEPYLKFMKERGASLKYILLTHIPSDYVSGALDLSRETNIPIYTGPNGYLQYEYKVLEDNEELTFGTNTIKSIYTPGHTIESTCFLLSSLGQPHSIYTGDTLLVNSVCFPDLALLRDISERELGLMLFDSIGRLKALPDDVLLYPGHTVGSVSVKRASDELSSTIGKEKENNLFFKFNDPEDFIKSLINLKIDIKNRSYLMNIARINIEGYVSLNESLKSLIKQLTPQEADRMSNIDCTIIDTRDRCKYNEGMVPNSLLIPLNENFCIWIGTMIKFSEKFIVISEPGKEEEVLKMLIRVGMYNIEGFVMIDKWIEAGLPKSKPQIITADLVFDNIYNSEYKLLDVREEIEHENGVLPYSIYSPLSALKVGLHDLPTDESLYIFCKDGGRSISAYSLLKKHGFDKLFILEDGILNLEKQDIPLIMK
jgi:hydroxyacylglutathione hydrolase